MQNGCPLRRRCCRSRSFRKCLKERSSYVGSIDPGDASGAPQSPLAVTYSSQNSRVEIKISLILGSSPPVASSCPPVSHPYLDVPLTEEPRAHGARSDAATPESNVLDGKGLASFDARLPGHLKVGSAPGTDTVLIPASRIPSQSMAHRRKGIPLSRLLSGSEPPGGRRRRRGANSICIEGSCR